MALLLLATCCGSPVEFDAVAIRADTEESGIAGRRYTRVFGRATNTSGSFVTIAVVETELLDAGGGRVAIRDPLALSLYLSPGESTYFASGGFLAPTHVLSRGPRARVRFLRKDPLRPAEYWRRFPAVRDKIAIEAVEVSEEADGVSVRGRVVNRSGVPMDYLIGSIALLDASRRPLAVESFWVWFDGPEPDAHAFGRFVPTPNGAEVAVAVPRVDAFRARRGHGSLTRVAGSSSEPVE